MNPTDLVSTRFPIRLGPVEYTLGTEADHEAVYHTLIQVFQGRDRESFLSSINDPGYRPEQRLLARVGGRIASHVHLTERSMRLGTAVLPMNGLMWIGTLPEFRGRGFAQNLIRLAAARTKVTGAVVQALTTMMPQFYRPLGWGVCGKQTVGQILSRNLPPSGDGAVETRGLTWHVRPWRQVEINDLMRLYDLQFGQSTGSIVRDEEYWRWIIGQRYAHIVWVACQGDQVHGYAFVKDHKILEIACDPAFPQAPRVLLGRIRAEALERAYPNVLVHAPIDHPVFEYFRQGNGQIIEQDEWEGYSSMFHIPDPRRFLECALPELSRLVHNAEATVPFELGLSVGDQRLMIHIEKGVARIESDRLSRRHISLLPASFTRLVLGHTGIDEAIEHDQAEASTATAIDAARIVFPRRSIWRSPLDNATA